MLSDSQMAEVVARDRKYRADMARDTSYGCRFYAHRTTRYNYIVPADGGEVTIVNVAVRIGKDGVPRAKEIMWMHPDTGQIESVDIWYKPVAGWTVEWHRADYRPVRKEFRDAPFVVADNVNGLSKCSSRYRFAERGINRAFDITVNPGALKGTRYEYCQYSDTSPIPVGLMEWLSLYRQEPRVELLAKAGLHCFICPAGLKALKDRRIFEWARANAGKLGQLGTVPIKYLLYSIRHDCPITAARDHFETVHNLSYGLEHARHHLYWGGSDLRADKARFKLRLDYGRLAKLLERWKVDIEEYGRYIEHAYDAGLDLRNEGTLYPPAKGGRRAFMRRLEKLEELKEKARRAERPKEDLRFEKLMAKRLPEIKRFQDSIDRTAVLKESGFTIVLAKSQKELRAEGRRMGNCVGNGSYGTGIVKGDTLIVMLRKNNRSLYDIEIDRRKWTVRQCYYRGNERASDKVHELAKQIAAVLKAKYGRMLKAKKRRAA